jgi:hypothetical protein
MKLLDRPPIPRAVRFAGYRPGALGQFRIEPTVNVSPEVRVEAPISIELGSLPLSVGLFAGSGIVFLMRTALPKGWPKTVALVTGGGLAAAGIINLFRGKVAAATTGAAPGAPGLPPSAAPSSPAGGITAQETQPSMAAAFDSVIGTIVSPSEGSTVDIGGWTSSYPVRIQLENPSEQPVNFILELRGLESGSLSVDQEAAYVAQVALGPRETKNVDLQMPIVTGHVIDVVNVVLQAFKRRVATEPAQMLNMRSFIVK